MEGRTTHWHWRSAGLFCCAFCVGLLPASGLPLANAQPDDSIRPASRSVWPETWLDDARLNSVYFVDRQQGWAVGERGVIWHTTDGGETWERTSLASDYSLTEVFFLDTEHGWISAAKAMPYAESTRGLVFRTRDGGKTWKRNQSNSEPAMLGVRFIDDRNGLAVTPVSARYPAGILYSRDSGHTWNGIPVVRGSINGSNDVGWRTLGTSGDQGLAVVGNSGSVLVWNKQAARLIGKPIVAPGLATAATVTPNGDVVLVTPTAIQIGSVRGGGIRWESSTSIELPVDIIAPSVVGSTAGHVNVIGSHGTPIWHSSDRGASWKASPSGCRVPLRDMHFVDEQAGWSVGDGGTIIATLDGGASWRVQRAGADRVALLVIAISPADIPWELLADTAARDGYRCHVVIMGSSSSISGTSNGVTSTLRALRLEQAVSQIGGMSVSTWWEFPLPDELVGMAPFAIERSWRVLHQSWGLARTGIDRLEQRLDGICRSLEPDVVLVCGPGGKNADADDPTNTTTSSEDDADDMTDLLCDVVGVVTNLPIKPVAQELNGDDTNGSSKAAGRIRLYSVSRSPDTEPLRKRLDDPIPILGASVREVAGRAAALVDTTWHEMDGRYQIVGRDLDAVRSAGNFFSGLTIPPGSAGRRPATAIAENQGREQRQIERRRNIESIIRATATGRSNNRLGWLSQLQSLAREFEPGAEQALLFQTSEQLWNAGRIGESRETLRGLLDTVGAEPLRDAVISRIVSRETSTEVQQWHDSVTATTAVRPATVAQEIRRTAGSEPVATWVERIEMGVPELQQDPEWMMAVAAHERLAGDLEEAERRFRRVELLATSESEWKWRAANELSLLRRESPVHGPMVVSVGRGDRPYLDGQIKSDEWSSIPTIRFAMVGLSEPGRTTDVWMSHDEGFLYVAIRAPLFAVVANGMATHPAVPQRDMISFDADRIVLRWDTNRDYLSVWELTIDRQGGVAERCLGNDQWNPKLYRAVHTGPDFWSAEIAIPWAEIAKSTPAKQEIWSCTIEQIVPQRGVAVWPDVATRSRAGYVQFGK